MEISVSEWANLIVRWFHVVAGIAWIGQTYLFNWFEKTMAGSVPPGSQGNVAGRLWMVHGGGFYRVEKQRAPEIMPETLHWFKWESALTWISGVLLLTIVYYAGGLMVEPDGPIGETAAIALGIGVMAGGWIAYNLIWKSPIGRNEYLGAGVSWALVVALACALSRLLSPRAAYMHVGAMFGTIMAANVWMVILPGQRKMLEAVKAGLKPDMAHGERGKRASKHNTYLSVPLVFLMVSNHFPTASYGHPYGWAVLGALILAGWGAAKLMRG